jgi:hypothetical protein
MPDLPSDGYLRPEDTIVRVTGRDRVVNATTGGLDESTFTAGTGTAHLSMTRDGAALAGTTLALTESTEGGTYYGTWSQATITAALSGVANGAIVYRVVTFTSVAPVASALTWQTVHV